MEKNRLRQNLSRRIKNIDEEENYTSSILPEETSDDEISKEISIIKKKIDIIYKKYGQIGLKLIDKLIIDLVQKMESRLNTNSILTDLNSNELEENNQNNQNNQNKHSRPQTKVPILEESKIENNDKIDPLLKNAAKMLTSNKKTVVVENNSNSFTPAKNTTNMVEHVDDDNSFNQIDENSINPTSINVVPSAEDQGDPAFKGGDMSALLGAVKMFK